jgi:predicted RNA-binding protein with PUA-like domain
LQSYEKFNLYFIFVLDYYRLLGMNYWLIKSEPFKYPWQQLVSDGKTLWEGVRNYQARIYLNIMQPGDKALFYHSNEGKEVVGIATITSGAQPDPTDDTGKWVVVEVSPDRPLITPVTLDAMRKHPLLSGMDMFRLNRLSITIVKPEEYQIVLQLGGLAD